MFGMFKSQSAALDLNPRNCLAVALLYCMAADGEMDEEEIGHLISVLGRGATRQQVDAALRYVRVTSVDQFIADSASRLRPDQRLCILLNMIDSAMSDGEAEQEEQALVKRFADGWGMPEAELMPHFQTLVAKNQRSLLDQ